jgi:hypothetical protein
MFQSLEKAADLEPNVETYSLLLKAYKSRDMAPEADILEEKLKKITKTGKRPKMVVRPKRVVI